ncbi:MAG TPA: EamA family transporter [Bryobacterales bacterium]|nr:EamA family transporter [Bryobacterales bacterium]
MTPRRAHAVKAYGSLAAVCGLWGTTFLAIRMASETLPLPFLVSGRFLVSGGLLLAACVARKDYLPRGRELADALLSGALVLGVGNGALTFAEHHIPSGIAALFVTTTPFWMVGMESLFPGGEPIHRPALAGLVVGFSGCALLVGPDLLHAGFASSYWKGFLAIQVGALGWSFGSIYNRNRPRRAHPIVSGAFQQLGAGIAWAPLALLLTPQPVSWTARSAGAFAYLVVFGSILGFSAYVYALDHLPISVASLYSYVNPVVAVWLGWLIYREPFGAREAAAMVVIFLGVGLVKMQAPKLESEQP